MDIYNESNIQWSDMKEDTKADIQHTANLFKCSVLEYRAYGEWRQVINPAGWYSNNVYRIRPGTEKPLRPVDEMDLTQLCKPQGLWQKETRDEMESWEHGWESYTSDGWSFMPYRPSLCATHAVIRAKPAPEPNLIEREGKKEIVDGYALWVALDAAHNLITTMTGGHLDKIQEYERAIK